MRLLVIVASVLVLLSVSVRGLECGACEAVASVLLSAAARGPAEPLFITAATTLCYAVLREEDEVVCRGVVAEFGRELFKVLQMGTSIEASAVCGALSFCPPLSFSWNITFPRPKPPPSPSPSPWPRPSDPGLATYSVLQLTDLHLDPLYAPGAPALCGKEPVCCRTSSPWVNGSSYPARKWGEYSCDLAPSMLGAVLNHLEQSVDPAPKILLWTGDSPPHFLWEQTEAIITQDLIHVSSLINSTFTGKLVVVPSIGNHAAFPVNNFADPKYGLQDWLYGNLSVAWRQWIPEDQQALFLRNGYFRVKLPPASPGGKALKIISMQTNYCNNLAFFLYLNDTDPGGQLEWLISELQESEDAGESVWITGHIPCSSSNCRSDWGAHWMEIMNRYEATITGQFYGHTHKDQFSVDRVEGGRASGVQYIAPSVTTDGGINPSWRFYSVSVSDHRPVDHSTWHMDLNATYATNADTPVLVKFYSALEAYNMTDLSPASWLNLALAMQTDDNLFDRYYYFYHTGTETKCQGKCRESQICGMLSATSGEYKNCTKVEREELC